MTTVWIESASRRMAIAAITGYQKYLSPHKGFVCAHRRLHGGDSCSQYIKRAIGERGLIQGISAARDRFRACREAKHTLLAIAQSRSQLLNISTPRVPRSERESPEQQRKKTEHWVNQCIDIGPCCEPIGGVAECVSDDCAMPDLGDCSAPDCGDCMSGLDCSGTDCCSWN